jgi:aminopeptidase-like protein
MFPQYHTSADDLQLVAAEHLHASLRVLTEVIDTLDANRRYLNREPFGEPQLGKRGLYQALGGTNIADLQLALLWVLNLSDGRHSLLDIAERSRMPFSTIRVGAELLARHGLLACEATQLP